MSRAPDGEKTYLDAQHATPYTTRIPPSRAPLIDRVSNIWQQEKHHQYDYDNDAPGCCDLENETSWPNLLRSRRGKMIICALLFVAAFVYTWKWHIRPQIVDDDVLAEGFRLRANGQYGTAKGGSWKHGGERLVQLSSKLLPGGQHDPHGKRRLVFVGDIHGCRKELQALLKAVHFEPKTDHLIATGDVISKGPDSTGVLDELIHFNATSVRGNHEDRILASLRTFDSTLSDDDVAASSSKGAARDHKLMKHLRPHHIAYLRTMPLILRIPALPQALHPSSKDTSPVAEELLVVHAGLVPDVPLEKQDPYFVMNMRSLGPRSHTPSSEHADNVKRRKHEKFRPWIDIWGWYAEHLFKKRSISEDVTAGVRSWISGKGSKKHDRHSPEPQVVVYGHDSKSGLRLRRWTKGLDSGCVSGGKLTAMVLDAKGRTEAVSVKCGEYW